MFTTPTIKSISEIQKDLYKIVFVDRLGNAIHLTDDEIDEKFGVKFGQMILTPKGLAFVLGQNKSDPNPNNLWVLMEYDHGVSYWSFDKKINETEHFSLVNQETSVSELLSKLDGISNYKLLRLPTSVLEYPVSQEELETDLTRIIFVSRENKTHNFSHNEEALKKHGMRFGQEITTPKGNAVIISIEERPNKDRLYVLMQGDNSLSFWSSPFTIDRGFHLRNNLPVRELTHRIYLASNYSEIIQQRLRAQDKFSKLKNKDQLQNEIALFFQKQYRSHLVQKKLSIQSLEKEQLTEEQAFVIGNDPIIPSELDQYKIHNQKIALIATSGMRAVELAARLGNSEHTPKIFLVDISIRVYQLWYEMREFIRNDTLCSTKDRFLSNFPDFLHKNLNLYRDSSFSEIQKYFQNLIDQYGYDFIRSIISNTSLVKQSWTDENTFYKIKNILNHLSIDKIFMYPSNIIACIDNDDDRLKVLTNIKIIDPILSIHTDIIINHPENVYFFKNEDPQQVFATLFAHGDASKQDASTQIIRDEFFGLSKQKILEKMLNLNDYEELKERIKSMENYEEAKNALGELIEEVENYKRVGNKNN